MAAPRPNEKIRDTSGGGALLVPHVECNRQKQDCALDDLLGGGGGTHELHAVGHDGHDETTDEGTGQSTNTAGRRRATDEAGSGGVELEHVSRRGLRTVYMSRVDDTRNTHEEAHIHVAAEGDLLDVDAGTIDTGSRSDSLSRRTTSWDCCATYARVSSPYRS